MRATLLSVVFLCALSACTSTASIPEEAQSHATAAFSEWDALERYLTASGVEVISSRRLYGINEPYVSHVFLVEFGRYSCPIYVYKTADAARQLGPSLGRYSVSRSAPTLDPSRSIDYTRTREAPVIRFGANVTPCTPGASRGANALLALQVYGEANGITAGIASDDASELQ